MDKKTLAQRRNYFKYIITGLAKPVDKKVLSITEQSWWETILTARTELLKNFNETSRNLGLNVIEPCWCGQRRKTKCNYEQCEKPLKNGTNKI